MSDPANIAIIIALEEEYECFKSSVKEDPYLLNTLKENIENDYQTFRYSNLIAESLHCEVFVLCIGEMASAPAFKATQFVIDTLSPDIILNIGIAGGLIDDVKIGDVILATLIDDYVQKTKLKDSNGDESIEYEWSGNYLPTTYQLMRDLYNFAKSNQTWKEDWASKAVAGLNFKETKLKNLVAQNKINITPEILSGPIASGPFLIGSGFAKNLLLSKNRKLLCVEMESAGVADLCHKQFPPKNFLCIRVVSDFSDNRKKGLDKIGKGAIRTWAMKNLSNFIIYALPYIYKVRFLDNTIVTDKSLHGQEIAPTSFDPAQLHEYVISKHLNKTYRELELSGSEYFDNFNEYFSLFLVSSITGDNTNILMDCCNHILNSSSKLPLVVYAAKGKGKSSFLAILYYALRDRCINEGTPLPIYLNISRSYKNSNKNSDSLSSVDINFTESLDELYQAISNVPGNEIIIILDGLNKSFTDSTTYKNKYFKEVLQILESGSVGKLVIGSRDESCFEDSFVTQKYECKYPEATIELTSLQTKSTLFDKFIKRYCEVSLDTSLSLNPDLLKQKILDFKLFEVDTFTISLIARNLDNPRFNRYKTFAQFLRDYCINRLVYKFGHKIDAEAALLEASEFEFNEFVRVQSPKGKNYRKAIGKNEFICNFLLTYFVVHRLKTFHEDPSQNISFFKYVYRDKRNNFFKELINEDKRSASRILENIKTIYTKFYENGPKSKENYRGRCHACYLSGRIEDAAIKDIAEEFLLQAKKDVTKEKEQDETLNSNDDFGLLERTIYISLAYLGNLEVMAEYIDRLFDQPYEDIINRGFHLKYYGDVPHDPRDRPMAAHDELEDCSKTFNHIAYKIQNLEYSSTSKLIEVEIHTLLSLVQHRHANNKLTINRDRVIEVIKCLIYKDLIRNPKLKKYARFIYDNLHLPFYSRIKSAFDLMRLKFVLRSGWERLEINENHGKRIESVAEHTFGTYLIALLFLRNKGGQEKGKNYSKDRILKILFMHDLAEAFTGDLISKTDEDRLREASWFSYIGLLGTYSGISNTSTLEKLWEEFENQSSLEGKIAKDIDLLESIFQLVAYSDYIDESEFQKFWSNVATRIETDTVNAIKDDLSAYLSHIKAYGASMTWPNEIVSIPQSY